ncbi:23732_t:CDS:2, partial [Racocetra persica]
LKVSSKTNPKFGKCCKQEKIVLPSLQDLPLSLHQLFEGQDKQSIDFHVNIRQYNAAYTFTLLGATIDQTVLNGCTLYCFCIYGELCYCSDSLLPETNKNNANYIQLYIYDPDSAHQIRIERNTNLCVQTMWKIQQILREYHTFYPKYQQAYEILYQACEEGTCEIDLAVLLHCNATTDHCCYNLSTSNKIAIILPGDGTTPEEMHNIIFHLWDGPLEYLCQVVFDEHGQPIEDPTDIYQELSDAIESTANDHPDIFGMMTANPNWKKIKSKLLSRQTLVDRPNLVVRVFELKCRALLHDIKNNNILKKVLAYVYTIEFQKRGLLYMHFLMFLDRNAKIRELDDVNKIVCAEFPNQKSDLLLFDTIFYCMINGQCGSCNLRAPCIENRDCKKNYPKSFNNKTWMLIDIHFIQEGKMSGHDYTIMQFGHEPDEIKQFFDTRYIGVPEAAWWLFGMHLHEKVPNV